MAAELNADGVVSKRYTRGIQLICDSSDRYYMHNAHGDVVESFSGTARSVHNYTAYGTPGYCENDDMDTFGYCGQQYDWETGNYYMRARYYNPDTGRFISEDTHWNPLNMIYGDKEYEESERKYPDITASLQAANLYGYCMGNPLRYSDVYGYSVWDGVVSAERKIWQAAVEGFRSLDYQLTARLLELSVSGEEKPAFYASDGTYAANALKNNADFRKAVNDLIYEKATKVGSNIINESNVYSFTTGGGDLGAALHNAEFSVCGKKENGVWNVTITVKDTFDFTEFVNPLTKSEYDGNLYQYFKGIVLWSGNDVVYVDQSLGIIKPVDVTIQYHDQFK